MQYQIKNNAISISPNPSGGLFIIETNSADKKNIDVFDINGRRMFSGIIGDKATIDLTNFNKGIYFLSIKTTNFIINKKLIIMH